jgi:hypothetical protein
MLKNFTELSQKLQIQMKSRLFGIRKFEILSKWSKLKKSSWENTYYKKQNATPEMIEYWCFLYPQDTELITGHPPQEKATGSDVDIQIPVLNDDASNVESRTLWVARNWMMCDKINDTEFANYLYEKSKFLTCNEVMAADWQAFLANTGKLTFEMLETIATWNPAFQSWMLTGSSDNLSQVNPNNPLTLLKRQIEEINYYVQLQEDNKHSLPSDKEPHLEQIYFENDLRTATNRYVHNSR